MRNAWSEPKGRRVLTQPAGAACWRSVLAHGAAYLQTSDEESL